MTCPELCRRKKTLLYWIIGFSIIAGIAKEARKISPQRRCLRRQIGSIEKNNKDKRQFE
jgi:hypothetical protein